MKNTKIAKRAAGICSLVALWALLFCIPARAQSKQSSTTAANEGAQLYPAHCGSCHGLDGRGGERAPDIVTRRELQKLSDAALAKIIREGIPGTGMPPFRSLGNSRVEALVRHLRTLQGTDAASTLPGSAPDGKSLFFGKAACSDCHMVNGAGGFMGSDLSGYAQGKTVAGIRAAILNPAADQERGRIVVVTTNDGQTLTGIARNEDNFSLQLQTRDGAFHFFEKGGLGTIEHRQESLMPSDYGKRLTSQEIDDLISYLMTVGRSSEPVSKVKQGEEAEE